MAPTATPVIDDTSEAARPAYCCLGCRLVQSPTRVCTECGAVMVAPLISVRELMTYRDMNLVEERDLWMISALLAGSSIVLPILLPLSLVTFGAWLARAPRRRRNRKAGPIAGIADVVPMPGEGAVTVTGPARALSGPARTVWDGRVCLAAELAVRHVGALYLRATAVADLVVHDPSGDVVVTGVVRFARPDVRYRVATAAVTGAEPRLAALGVPATWQFAGMIVEHAIGEGDALSAVGVIGEEGVPALTGLRQGGVARVMRGTPSAPVVLHRVAA